MSLRYELRFNTTVVTNNESTVIYIPEEMYKESSAGDYVVEHDSRLGMSNDNEDPNIFWFGTKTMYEAGSEMVIKVMPKQSTNQDK